MLRLKVLPPRLLSTQLHKQLVLAPSVRAFSSSGGVDSKASRARALKKPPPRLSKTEGLRGTGIGASTRVYSPEENVLGRDTNTRTSDSHLPPPENSPARHLSAKDGGGEGGGSGLGEVEDESYNAHRHPSDSLRPSVAANEAADDRTLSSQTSKAQPSSSEPSPADANGKAANDGFGPDTTFYSSTPPYNVPLVLTFSVVVTMFCVIGADTARTGWTKYDEETKEWKLAPAWQRWTYCIGMGSVGIAAATWGALAPSRVIAKMTIRRPLSSTSSSRFPPSALVTLHTPVSKLPLYPRRTVSLSSINLLGPLSTSPKPWHPKSYIPPAKPPRKGIIADTWRKISKAIIAPPNPRKANSKPPVTGTHVPILIEGDRFTYSIQKTRGPTGTQDDKTGAWCEDWEALEKALLGAEGR